MKLHEIKGKPHSSSEVISFAYEDHGIGDLEIKVTYDFSPASKTRHGDNSSFDEYHDESIEVLDAVLNAPADEVGEDGEVEKIWPKGTSVDKLPGWNKKTDQRLEDALRDELADYDD